jgi:creatinine amidohydrolase
MEKVLYQDFTWPQLKEALEQPNHVVILPTGAIEQHGHHCPFDTDNLPLEVIAERGARSANERGARVIVMPIIRWGFSSLHMDLPLPEDQFPGTLTLSPNTYLNLVTELMQGAIRAGAKRVLIVNWHGANTQILQVAVRHLRDLTGALIGFLTPYNFAKEEVLDIIDEGILKHAGEAETALVMATRPELIDANKMEKEVAKVEGRATKFFRRDDLESPGGAGRVMIAERNPDFSPTGTLGDPTIATKEKGEKLLQAMSEKVGEFLVEFSTWEYGKI